MRGRSIESVILGEYHEPKTYKIDLLNLTEETSALLRKLLTIYHGEFYFSDNVYYGISDNDGVAVGECVLLSHDLLKRMANPDGKNPGQIRHEVMAKQTNPSDEKEYSRDVLATLVDLDGKFVKKIKTEDKKRVVIVTKDAATGEKRKSLQHGYNIFRADLTKHAKPPTFFARQCYIVMHKHAKVLAEVKSQQEDVQPVTSALI